MRASFLLRRVGWKPIGNTVDYTLTFRRSQRGVDAVPGLAIMWRIAASRQTPYVSRLEDEMGSPVKSAVRSSIVVVDYDHCSYCGACVAVCPPDCITLHDATLLIDTDSCTLCRRCLPACPTGALTLQEAVA